MTPATDCTTVHIIFVVPGLKSQYRPCNQARNMTPPRSTDHHMVFTIPRTASHLLLKLLNLQEQHTLHRLANNLDGYIFFPAAGPRFEYSLPGKPLIEWESEQVLALKSAMQDSFSAWLKFIDESEYQSKGTFVKEHLNWMADPLAEASLYGYQNVSSSNLPDFRLEWPPSQNSSIGAKNENNVTCLPDTFLLQRVKPTFLIRHPALTFPSCLRTAIDNQGVESVTKDGDINRWECTYHWSLLLYTFYTNANAADFDRRSYVDEVQYPIVLDAQDLGDEALVKKYARAVGLDEEKVRFAWKAAGEEEVSKLGKVTKRMQSTILASSGVEKKKLEVSELDIEKLRGEWKAEFGEVLSERLIELVEKSTFAYETLKSARLKT